MRISKSLALLLLAGVVAAGCQAAPDSSGPNAVAESAAGDSAATDSAAAVASTTGGEAAAETGQRQRRERPQPNAPRAEGAQLAEFLASADVLLLDVRRPEELEELGTVKGYLNIPIEELADRLEEVPRDKPILTA